MEMLEFLIEYGEWVLFAGVFLEQIGLPFPSIPILVAAGALVGTGEMNGPLVIALAGIATMAADLIWYQLGRRSGTRVLGLLCKISLEPDACKRLTEQVFARHGLASLLVVKFIPGLSTIAPPLAGITKASLPRFLLYDGAGTLIWVGTFIGLGALFSDQLEQIGIFVAQWAAAVGILAAVIFAGYIGYKLLVRTLMIRKLRIARISADELRRMMDSGDEVMVVDLRHPLDIESAPYSVPGALRMSPEEIDRRHEEIPKGQEVILYCS